MVEKCYELYEDHQEQDELVEDHEEHNKFPGFEKIFYANAKCKLTLYEMQ